jgi:hypothetical protein
MLRSSLLRQMACICCIESFLPTGALLFDEKIRQSAPLFWFGLQDVGILHIFYSRSVIQRTISCFFETGLAERLQFVPIQSSAEEAGRLDVPVFSYEAALKFELFSNIQYQN